MQSALLLYHWSPEATTLKDQQGLFPLEVAHIRGHTDLHSNLSHLEDIKASNFTLGTEQTTPQSPQSRGSLSPRVQGIGNLSIQTTAALSISKDTNFENVFRSPVAAGKKNRKSTSPLTDPDHVNTSYVPGVHANSEPAPSTAGGSHHAIERRQSDQNIRLKVGLDNTVKWNIRWGFIFAIFAIC